MNKYILNLFRVCALVVVLVSNVFAQDIKNARIGTAAGAELLIPVGARDMAMSGSGIATSSGIDAIHWNIGGLSRLGDTNAQGLFSSMSYIADIKVNYGAVALKFGTFGTVAISIKSLDFGDIPLTTTDDPEGFAGRTYSPAFTIFGISYGRSFTDAITAGFTLKLISENIHRVAGSGYAIDAGIQYHGVAGFEGLDLGVVLKNVGPQIEFDGPGLLRTAVAADGRRPAQFYKSETSDWELPTSVEIGLSYGASLGEELSYTVNSLYANNNLALDSYKFGGEVVYNVGTQLSVAGRGGVNLLDKGELDEQIFGPTFGFGLTYFTSGVDVTVDYAYRSVDFFNNNSMFSLRLDF
ncbi:PorV/PorQ family protein [candidate division KSB1 bacterium]|nr:PorV/PorQ family protein [candidate division KSB1 bacterium]